MFRILHDTKVDFIKQWRAAVAITVVWIVVGFAILAVRHVNWGIEFTGGTLVQLQFDSPPGDAELRETIAQGGFPGAEIQPFGSPTEYTVRAQPIDGETQSDSTANRIADVLSAKYGDGATVVRSEFVGPSVGAQLRQNAAIAVVISFFIVLGYLAFRFEWRFGLAAVVATAHDILATVAFIAILDLEISLTVVAAILTVIGYSLNDTIIIFDRVRENLKKQRKESLYDVVNRSINETLPRSVLTHGTTLAATLALLLFAGEVIRPFSWVMTFGIFTGTFSSIYVAGALLLYIEGRWPRSVNESRGGRSARPVASERKRGRPDAVTTR